MILVVITEQSEPENPKSQLQVPEMQSPWSLHSRASGWLHWREGATVMKFWFNKGKALFILKCIIKYTSQFFSEANAMMNILDISHNP
jgi:hypothetical protein